ncbi:sulfite exporter TauE/SafE family protein [Succinimonas amylolytica]|uniref:sulfite exporter TauE/SafE family protein n=1 Tax=Succinimonas amylolytica TaxID=83769 RepID=UPI0023A876DC
MDSIVSLAPVVAILCISGIAAGFLAGLLGVGGGIIFVPVYYFIFTDWFAMSAQEAIVLATCTSLATMIPTTMSSSLSHIRHDNYLRELLLRWLPWLCVGVGTGTVLSHFFGGAWLSTLFGCILLFAACNLIFFSKARGIFTVFPAKGFQAVIALGISGLSVMLGIGGGTLTVPFLSLFRDMDTKKIVGTASVIGLIVCLPGAVITVIMDIIDVLRLPDNVYTTFNNAPALTFGHICFPAVLCVAPFAMLFAPLGVRINRKLPPHIIKIIFGIMVVFTSIKMLISGS